MTALGEYWRIALGALRANWFRALLTALGVVIGVASLITVTAVSDGASAEISASIQRLGANVVEVDGEYISVGSRQSATDRVITPGMSGTRGLAPVAMTISSKLRLASIAASGLELRRKAMPSSAMRAPK